LPQPIPQPEDVSPHRLAVIFNVTGNKEDQPVETTEVSASLSTVFEHLDANPFEDLFPSDSFAPASMSPNVRVLDAKSELLLVFATEMDLAEPSKYSSLKMSPQNQLLRSFF